MNRDPQRSDVPKPWLVLVTGLPGTGKSTVAEAVADRIGAPVLAHDWAMSALRPYPEVQSALDRMPMGHRVVGWSTLHALARSQLRAGRSVILDGVARADELRTCREIARDEDASMVVIATQCSDPSVHRSRVEGRERLIPNWHELDWVRVERSRATWESPDDADLSLDAATDWNDNLALLNNLFADGEGA
jgi:hypothetical protein